METKRILVVTDIQNDFCSQGGILYHRNLADVVPRISQRIITAIEREEKILFSMDSHWWGDYRDTIECDNFPLHTEPGSWGEKLALPEAIMKKININPKVWTYRKTGFVNINLGKAIGGFIESDRESSDPSYFEIEVCGVLTSICVLNLALFIRACAPRAAIIVKKSLTADVNEEARQAAFVCMEKNLIEVLSR